MKCESSRPWTQERAGLWTARDSDGYTLRVAWKEGAWRWSVRPPSAGYEIFAGVEADVALAKDKAEAALRDFIAELLTSRRRASPKSSGG